MAKMFILYMPFFLQTQLTKPQSQTLNEWGSSLGPYIILLAVGAIVTVTIQRHFAKVEKLNDERFALIQKANEDRFIRIEKSNEEKYTKIVQDIEKICKSLEEIKKEQSEANFYMREQKSKNLYFTENIDKNTRQIEFMMQDLIKNNTNIAQSLLKLTGV